ncbi:MAG TPA: glycosyl hydrolase family 28-related protein [Gammaproteobacteria bacterium]|nr:glycosyl hydrolase family 28-related protein [Gammaproteobacteria bacterium]
MTWLDDYLLRQQVVIAGFTLDLSSAALQVGDWFCVSQSDTSGSTVTKAVSAALAAAGAALAIAVESAQPGQPVRGIPLGMVPRIVSGLAAGGAGPVSIDDNARTERGGDPNKYVGFTDANGTLTIGRLMNVTPGAVKTPVDVATTAALPANTRTVNTLQANANGALGAQDGVAAFVGMRVLVWKEATAANNGVYRVTQLGSAGSPWIMVRDGDADSASELVSGTVWPVSAGTLYGLRRFILSVSGSFTLNTDPIAFTLYELRGVYDVRAFGAVGDGTTDDSSAIANAIAACIAGGGGDVFFGPGVFSTNNFNVANATGVRLRGLGDKVSIIKARQTGSIITFTNCVSCYPLDLGIERADALFLAGGGYSLVFNGCTRCGSMGTVRISYCGAGVQVNSCTEMRFGRLVVEKMTAGGGAGFFLYTGSGAAPSNDCIVDSIIYDHTYPVIPTFNKGVWTASTAYVVGDIVSNNDRFWICTTAGNSAASGGPTNTPGVDGPTAYTTDVVDGTVHWRFLIGNSFGVNHDHDANNLVIRNLDCAGPINNGVQMWKSGGTSAPKGLFIDRCRVVGAISNGVVLDTGSRVRIVPAIDTTYGGRGIDWRVNMAGHVEILGGTVENCWTDGVAIGGGGDILGTEVLNCGQKGANQGTGITTFGSISGFRVVGVRSSGPNHSFGMTVGALCANYVIEDNDFTGNFGVGLNDNSKNTAGSSRKVRDNLGDDGDRAQIYLTPFAASIGATNLFAAIPPKGVYHVTTYLAMSGGTGGTITVQVTHTDDKGATSITPVNAQSLAGTSRRSDSSVIETDGATTPQYSVTIVGATGAPACSLRIIATRMND